MQPWLARLGVTISSAEISREAHLFWDEETIAAVNRASRVLNDIGVSWALERPSSFFLERASHRFLELAKRGREDLLEGFSHPRDVAHLSWALDYKRAGKSIIESGYLEMALEVIEGPFVDGMLSPLVSLLLKYWLTFSREELSKLMAFLEERVELYSGSHPQLVFLKVYKEFILQKRGPQELASLIQKEGLSLWNLRDYIPLLEGFRGVEYLGEALFCYVQLVLASRSSFFLDEEVFSLLKEIDLDYVSSLCLVPMILGFDEERSLTRESLLNASFDLLGDPVDDNRWRISPRATSLEEEELERARERLNRWFSEGYLPLLLERIEMDKDRQLFWVENVDYIDYFYVYCGAIHYDDLMEDSGLRAEAKGRLRRLMGDKRVSALALMIKGWVFFVFSKKGHASYVYDSESTYCPAMKESLVLSVDEIKGQDLEALSDRRAHEFRLIHRKGWENRLREWLSYHLAGRRIGSS